MFKSLLLATLLVSTGLCQRTRTTVIPHQTIQSLYGQCGGKSWSGPVACPTGSYCANDGTNEWYSQCVAAEANDPVGDSPITTRVRTTTISVAGPTPTVVTTFITYLTPVAPGPTATTITLIPDEPYTPTWP